MALFCWCLCRCQTQADCTYQAWSGQFRWTKSLPRQSCRRACSVSWRESHLLQVGPGKSIEQFIPCLEATWRETAANEIKHAFWVGGRAWGASTDKKPRLLLGKPCQGVRFRPSEASLKPQGGGPRRSLEEGRPEDDHWWLAAPPPPPPPRYFLDLLQSSNCTPA